MLEPNLKDSCQGVPEILVSQELDRWADGQPENIILSGVFQHTFSVDKR